MAPSAPPAFFQLAFNKMPDSQKRRDKTSKGLEIPVRKRDAVLHDFEKASGPLRGQNQDRKPKA